jgi:protein-tyrosine phosphatase
MIDLHVHILPELDDGPETVAEAIALAKAAFEDGTKTLVATPHILNHFDERRNQRFLEVYSSLKRRLESELPNLELLLGSEIYFRPGLYGLAHLEAATINNTGRYMLVEFPFAGLPEGFEKELAALKQTGVIPIIAHPERTIPLFKKPSLINRILDAGALLQINAGSLTGVFGRSIKKMAYNLLKERIGHLIATDGHGVNRRMPSLKAAYFAAAEVMGEAEARRLVEEHPRLILEGLPCPANRAETTVVGGIK